MSVEALQETLLKDRFSPAGEQGIDLVGGEPRKASVTGLGAEPDGGGHAPKADRVARRAQQNDPDLHFGQPRAAYMGLRLLERKRVLADVENPEPKFGGYEVPARKIPQTPSAQGHCGCVGGGGHRSRR